MDPSAQIPTRGSLPALSPASFGLALVAVLAVFVGLNPIWSATDVQSWDENIWYSYAPIPLLVALLLLREGKLAWGPFVVETMKLGLVKLTITYLAAHAIWAIQGPPVLLDEAPPSARTTTSGDSYAPRPRRPDATELDPARTGGLRVSVRDEQGAPRAGVLVRVVDGLQPLSFAPPPEALELLQAGAGFEPRLSVAQTWQDVRLVSRDDGLHTAVLADAGRQHVLNYPLVAGATRELMFRRAHGVMSVRCSVHGAAEPGGHVVVVDNPFHGLTDAAGRVAWSGVPAGALTLQAWDAGAPGGAEPPVEQTLQLAAGVTAELAFVLPR